MEILYLIGAVVAIIVLIILFLKIARKIIKMGLFLLLVGAASFFILKFLNLI